MAEFPPPYGQTGAGGEQFGSASGGSGGGGGGGTVDTVATVGALNVTNPTGPTVTLTAPQDEWHATLYGIFADNGDHGAALQTLMNEISLTGGTLVLPGGGWIESVNPFVVPIYVSIRGPGWYGAGALKVNADVDCVQMQIYGAAWVSGTAYTVNEYVSYLGQLYICIVNITGTTPPPSDSTHWAAVPNQNGVNNAFFCHVSDLMIYGNLNTGASPTAQNHGLHVTTNPANSSASVDPEFDPQHLFERIYIKENTGDGFHQDNSRSENVLSDVWSEANNGVGFFLSYDTELQNCKAEGNGTAGFLGSSVVDVKMTGCSSYNNGAAYVWADYTSGGGWSLGDRAFYENAIYTVIEAIEPGPSTTPPPSDPTHFQLLYDTTWWGDGLFLSHCARFEIAAFSSDQNPANAIHLFDSSQVNFQGRASSVGAGFSALVLDNSNNNIINLTAQYLTGAYVIQLINGSTGNIINVTTDGSYTAIFTLDSANPVGSGNYICVDGVVINPVSSSGVSSTSAHFAAIASASTYQSIVSVSPAATGVYVCQGGFDVASGTPTGGFQVTYNNASGAEVMPIAPTTTSLPAGVWSTLSAFITAVPGASIHLQAFASTTANLTASGAIVGPL